MFEADASEEGRKDDSDDSDLDALLEKTNQAGSTRRRAMGKKLLHGFFGCFLVAAVILLLTKGAFWRKSGKKFAAPTAKPAQLFSNGTSNFGPTTILISLDGFRADFLERGLTPSLSSFLSSGVSPKYMLPSFPSVTFPNHWTLITGLYPSVHGVVGNSFWDDDLGEQFFYTDPARSMFPKWWTSTGAEPLWATAERQGIRSAIHMWPGSEAGIQPEPTYLDDYNAHEKLDNKVSRVLGLLDLPSPFDTPADVEIDTDLQNPRPQFIALYVPDVDRDGHLYGPNSTEIRSTITEVDTMVGKLLSGLETRNLSDIVNVVVVSDHGMATTSRDRLVQFEDLVSPDVIERYDGWPLYGLRLKPGVNINKLYTSLTAQRAAAGSNPGWSVYTHETMPERWHFSGNPRIAPLFLIPDAGWSIVTKAEMDLSSPSSANEVYHPKGIHGYDHEHPLMRAIFAARGPAFPHPPGSRLEPFINTNVYSIVCQSIGVIPMSHNGSLTLPLTTQGVHGDGGDGDTVDSIDDLPAGAEPEAASSDEQAAQQGGSSNADDQGGASDADEKTSLADTLKTIYDTVVDKLGAAKGWVQGLFGEKKIASDG